MIRHPAARARPRPLALGRILATSLALGAALVTWQAPATAQSDDEPISVAEYLAGIERAIDLLEESAPGANDALDAAREAEPTGPVRLLSGGLVQPRRLVPFATAGEELAPDGAHPKEDVRPSIPTLDEPRAETGTPEAVALPVDSRSIALARLGIVRDQLSAAESDQAEARREVLARILERPEFQIRRSLLDRLLDWLADLIPDVEVGAPGARRAVELFLAIVGSMLIVAVFGFWLRGLLARLAADTRLSTDGASRTGLPATAAEAAGRAAEAARSASYREAVRQLYHFALLSLDEQGALDYDASLTNREYLALLDGPPGLAARFRPVVSTFDEVWYGVTEPDVAVFETYESEVGELLEAAGRPDPNQRRSPRAG